MIAGVLIHELRLLFTALQFFTRLPVPGWVGFEPAWLGRCVRWLPAVGLLVGAIGGAVFYTASGFWAPGVAALLSIAATVLATGAFHEDGFADVCDGLGGSQRRDRALEIMADSRVGAFGAIGIVLLLVLKAATVAQWSAEVGALLIAGGHVVSRVAPLLLMAALPYVRLQHGGGDAAGISSAPPPAKPLAAKPLAEGVRWRDVASGAAVAVLCAGALAVAAVAWLDDPQRLFDAMVIGALAALAAALPIGLWFRRRLGGITGDCLGAAQQLSEIVFCLAASLLLNLAVAG